MSSEMRLEIKKPFSWSGEDHALRCVHASNLNHLGTPSSSVVQLLSHHRHDALPSLHLNKQATLAF